MVVIAQKIKEVIDAPEKEFNKKEAISILRYCGILDKNNNITPKFKDIVVRKENGNR